MTVRNVKGENPTKVIIGELPGSDIKKLSSNTLFVSQNHDEIIDAHRKIKLLKTEQDYDPDEILKSLYNKGLGSVYVEGGAYTTSCFLKSGCIDHLQIHYAAKILGSGNIGFEFPGITTIKNALSFGDYRFVKMGNDVMFLGEPNQV